MRELLRVLTCIWADYTPHPTPAPQPQRDETFVFMALHHIHMDTRQACCKKHL